MERVSLFARGPCCAITGFFPIVNELVDATFTQKYVTFLDVKLCRTFPGYQILAMIRIIG